MQYDQLMQLPWQQFLEEVLRECPKNTTWYDTRDWLKTQYTPQQIAEMYVKLDKHLMYMIPYSKEEEPQADHLRDYMDIFWYATESELIEKLLGEQNESIDSTR